MPIDLVLAKDETTGLQDISITDGDFTSLDSFDTSIKVSLFADERADSSEVQAAEKRRGWWGNQFNDDDISFQLGSKLWLLDQARLTQDTLNSAIDISKNALQWLIDDGHANDVVVTGEFAPEGIRITVTIFRDQARTETRYYDLWENSGDAI